MMAVLAIGFIITMAGLGGCIYGIYLVSKMKDKPLKTKTREWCDVMYQHMKEESKK